MKDRADKCQLPCVLQSVDTGMTKILWKHFSKCFCWFNLAT